jgi:hypothetical protein
MNLIADKAVVCDAGSADCPLSKHRLVHWGDVKCALETQWPEQRYQFNCGVSNFSCDPKRNPSTEAEGIGAVLLRAADMGGMGVIENSKAHCMLSVPIRNHRRMAVRDTSVPRSAFPAWACVSSADEQKDVKVHFGWERSVRLREGLARKFAWAESEMYVRSVR